MSEIKQRNTILELIELQEKLEKVLEFTTINLERTITLTAWRSLMGDDDNLTALKTLENNGSIKVVRSVKYGEKEKEESYITFIVPSYSVRQERREEENERGRQLRAGTTTPDIKTFNADEINKAADEVNRLIKRGEADKVKMFTTDEIKRLRDEGRK